MNSVKILEGFNGLCEDDKNILSTEMSFTGCMGQSYSSNIAPVQDAVGPGVLIYYGPAFLQALGNDSPVQRLQILAALYRGARELWPAKVASVGQTVTIRIDTIKALSVREILDVNKRAQIWLMIKQNDQEGVIELSSTSKLNKYIAHKQALYVLEFNNIEEQAQG